MDIAEAVARNRKKHGWTQAKLAGLAGVHLNTIQRIESGSTPSVDTLLSLEGLFGCHLHEVQKEVHDEAENSSAPPGR